MGSRIAAAWRGELPLWLTYWVLGVGGNMSFVALLLLIYFTADPDVLGVLWIVYALSLVWFVFIFGAIWRAAGRYRGRRIWAFLARLGVSVGIVRMTVEAIMLAKPYI